MTDDERNKILEEIHKKTKKELDSFMNRQCAELRPFYSNAFNQEIDRYKVCMKKRDYFNAALHFDIANSINEYLKNLKMIGL
jgi:hypothetical protein